MSVEQGGVGGGFCGVYYWSRAYFLPRISSVFAGPESLEESGFGGLSRTGTHCPVVGSH